MGRLFGVVIFKGFLLLFVLEKDPSIKLRGIHVCVRRRARDKIHCSSFDKLGDLKVLI